MADKVEPLRTSLKCIARATGDAEVLAAIPTGNPFNGEPYAEAGWNRLAAFLVGWCERHAEEKKQRDEAFKAFLENPDGPQAG